QQGAAVANLDVYCHAATLPTTATSARRARSSFCRMFSRDGGNIVVAIINLLSAVVGGGGRLLGVVVVCWPIVPTVDPYGPVAHAVRHGLFGLVAVNLLARHQCRNR